METLTTLKDVHPGDVIDIVPAMKAIGQFDPNESYCFEYYSAEVIEHPSEGMVVLYSTEGGNYALPADVEVPLIERIGESNE